MSESELEAILEHPRMKALLRVAIRRTAAVIAAEKARVPDDSLTYKQAVKKYGYTYASIRTMVATGVVEGGNGIILRSSMDSYIAGKYARR